MSDRRVKTFNQRCGAGANGLFQRPIGNENIGDATAERRSRAIERRQRDGAFGFGLPESLSGTGIDAELSSEIPACQAERFANVGNPPFSGRGKFQRSKPLEETIKLCPF